MRELLRWALPGLVVVGPLRLFTDGPLSIAGCIGGLLIAIVVGFVLQQSVRAWFEGRNNGFRSPRRAALAAIIERGNLGGRADAGDLAYQVYETVFYQRSDWQAARDHAHRCWDIIFLCRSTGLGCAVGAGVSALALLTGPCRLLALVVALGLSAAGSVLVKKSQQTEAALQLFDRALVLAHWPHYEPVLGALLDT